MVNRVSKGAGRAAAKERTNRHAQRTPLPPKPGVVDGAKAVLAAAKIPKLRKTAGMPKAEKFRADIAEHSDWAVKISTPDDDTTILTATRGEEYIELHWHGESFVYGPSHHSYEGIRQQIRNASQGRKIAATSASDASNDATKRRDNSRSFGRRKGVGPEAEPVKRVLPFDITLAMDEDIIDAIRGKEVAWHNRISDKEEVALVGVRGSETSKVEIIEQEKDGRSFRVVMFCCPATGYRSFRLEDLTGVGSPGTFSSGRKLTRADGGEE